MTHIRSFPAVLLIWGALATGGNCGVGDPYNPGDPASEEYYLQILLRCALQDANVCPSVPTVTQIAPGALGSSLQLWLEADALGLADNALVTSWTDQSSNGFNATQATGAQQPTYKVGVLGGKPAVRFNNVANPGTNLTLGTNSLFSANDGLTILAVGRSNAEDDATDFVFDFGRLANTGYGLGYSANADGSANNNASFYTSSDHGGPNVSSIYQAGTSDSVVLVARIKFSPAADKHQSVYVNGSLTATDTSHTLSQLTTAEITESATRMGNSGPVTIGGQSKSGAEAGRFFDGDIALVLMFNKAITESERQGLECYASLKYGIPVSQNCI